MEAGRDGDGEMMTGTGEAGTGGAGGDVAGGQLERVTCARWSGSGGSAGEPMTWSGAQLAMGPEDRREALSWIGFPPWGNPLFARA